MIPNPSPDPPNHWFYLDREKAPQGPLPLAAIEALISNGTLPFETLVCREGEDRWTRFDIATLPPLPQTEDIPSPPDPIPDDVPLSPVTAQRGKKVEEYRRTCQSCGKVWHSLAEREKEIESDMQHNRWMECSESMSCCSYKASAAQANRSVAAQKGELSRLRTCPACQSANYKEERLEFHAPDSQ